MKLNRRQFLQGMGAAAVVASLPPAIAAPTPVPPPPTGVTAGIESVGNGWYRCWMQFEEKITSTYAKSTGKPNFWMQSAKAYAHFDLDKGTVEKCGESDERIRGVESKLTITDDFSISAEDAHLWGVQQELCPTSHLTTYVPTATPTKSGLLSETPRTNRIAHSVAHSCGDSPLDPSRHSSSVIGLRSNPGKLSH